MRNEAELRLAIRDLYRGDGGRLSSYDEGWNDGTDAAAEIFSAENAALRAEVEALREAADEYALGDARYEYIRRLNAAQFAELYRRNIAENVPFDDLVDAARKESA
jgi:hypothetical protein